MQQRIYRAALAEREHVVRMTIIRWEQNDPTFPRSRTDDGGRRYYLLDEVEAWEAARDARADARMLAEAGLVSDPEQAAALLSGRLRGAAKRKPSTATVEA
jgi:hypothetical protein